MDRSFLSPTHSQTLRQTGSMQSGGAISSQSVTPLSSAGSSPVQRKNIDLSKKRVRKTRKQQRSQGNLSLDDEIKGNMTPRNAAMIVDPDDEAYPICDKRNWISLKNAPRELWVIFVLKFLSSYSYFSFALVLVLFLSEDYGMGDVSAGWAYGIYGVMSTVFGILCGWIVDYLGVRWSLITGSLLGTVARLLLAFTTSSKLAVANLATLLPFAECLQIPIMTIGIKRYTNSSNRTFAYSLYYSVMNVAALIAGPMVDLIRAVLGEGCTIFGYHFSSMRLILLTSAMTTALCLFVVFAGIREIAVDEDGNVHTFHPNRENPFQSTFDVLKERDFWRLVLFTLLLMGVGLIFRHVDATLPKYMLREFGPNAPFGLVYAINPLLIITLVPIVGLLTKNIPSYPMIMYGSFVAGASPFWVCVGNYLWAVILFVVTLSVGEAVYSPRVYEYSMKISGEGKEGLYTSLASAPIFAVKLIVGGMSGWLLETFCAETPPPPRNGRAMWAIIGAVSFASPILMVIFRKPLDVESRKTTEHAMLPVDSGSVVQEVERNGVRDIDIEEEEGEET